MSVTRVLCVFGTRPDAVKMAPVIKELQRYPDRFAVRVVVTGQHREQLDQVLRAFQITPDHDLGIMQHGQTLTQITTRALEGLDAELRRCPADVCLAQGDTTTTFVAALAAFYHRVPFGHVEAGLRTGSFYDPFPEEMNRRLAGALATWHFAPTAQAREHLLAENVSPERIHVTGNTSIDALRMIAEGQVQDTGSTFQIAGDNGESISITLDELLPESAQLVLVTAHRRENWGEPMARIGRAVAQLAADFPECVVVVALHRNPIVRQTLIPILSRQERVRLIEPPDYLPFVRLMQRAQLILTDSGGVQEEAPTFGVPVLVLRRTTERQEGIDAGTARLVGTDPNVILTEARRLLTDPQARATMARAVNPYGDGRAAERIVQVLMTH